MSRALNFVLRLRRPISIGIHSMLIVFSHLAAFWLRFDASVPEAVMINALTMLPWVVSIRLLVFAPFRLFEGLWKYTSLWDLRNILLGVIVSTVVLYPVASVVAPIPGYPRSILLIDSLLLVFLLGAPRMSRRLHRELFQSGSGHRRVLVYGAGDAGEMIVRDMRQNPRYDAKPIGFVDDNHHKVGQRIHGVPVHGGREQLPAIIRRYSPDEVLIALPSTSRETLRQVVRALEPYKVRITTLPRLSDLVGGSVQVDQIRQLKVEDLLAREPVGLDYLPVRQFLHNKSVLVTGAGGSIGSELCRQIAGAGAMRLVLLDRYENSLFHIHNELSKEYPDIEVCPVIGDVTDARRVDQVFGRQRLHVVFHAAAHKHVPLMEDNPCEAVKNNVRGSRLVAEAAVRHKVERFILISTDKAVNPTSVMGSTKRLSELIVDSLSTGESTRFAAVRFGNVLASNGSVVPTFQAQIAKGGPVTVTHPEIKRFFMLIPEAVQLVLHAAALSDRAPLFVLDMGEQVKVADLARDVIRLSGLVPDRDIEIRFTGLRPGEKMFEELVGDGEHEEPTELAKILRVRTSSRRNLEGLNEAVARLEALALDGRSDDVLRELRTILAAFTPPTRESSPV